MSSKRTINLAVPEPLLAEFNEVCQQYGHGKQKGLVLSAALLMFLESHPEQQGKALERVLLADVRGGVEQMLQRAREHQARQVSETSASPARPRKAAKKAGRTRKGFKG